MSNMHETILGYDIHINLCIQKGQFQGPENSFLVSIASAVIACYCWAYWQNRIDLLFLPVPVSLHLDKYRYHKACLSEVVQRGIMEGVVGTILHFTPAPRTYRYDRHVLGVGEAPQPLWGHVWATMSRGYGIWWHLSTFPSRKTVVWPPYGPLIWINSLMALSWVIATRIGTQDECCVWFLTNIVVFKILGVGMTRLARLVTLIRFLAFLTKVFLGCGWRR